jgi:hypothetical protein
MKVEHLMFWFFGFSGTCLLMAAGAYWIQKRVRTALAIEAVTREIKRRERQARRERELATREAIAQRRANIEAAMRAPRELPGAPLILCKGDGSSPEKDYEEACLKEIQELQAVNPNEEK